MLIETETKTEDIRFPKRLRVNVRTPILGRPLLIRFRETASRISILDNARKLADDEKRRNVNVVHDLTQMQRKEGECLRKEADRLNDLLSESDEKRASHGRRQAGKRRVVQVRVEEGRELGSRRGRHFLWRRGQ